MKRLLSVLAAVVAASGLIAVGAYAAKDTSGAPAAPSAEVIKKGKAEAPAAVTQAHLSCTIKNAAYAGAGQITIDKKKVAFEAYEVACDDGSGYVVDKFADGTGQAHSCLVMQKAYEVNKKGYRCSLPENVDLNAQMQRIVDKSGATCTVTGESYVGSTDKLDRYEVGCAQGSGYLIDALHEGTPTAITCLQAEAVYDCKLTPKAQRMQPVIAWTAAADKSCQVTNARFVGVTEAQHQFFEVACTGKPGYMLETNGSTLVKSVPCAEASGIGGGCTLTDMSQLKVGIAQSYGSALQSNGLTCNFGTNYQLLGKEPKTGRDVVEFSCPAEHPAGLVAMIVGPTAHGKFEAYDCFGARFLGTECSLTKKQQLLANLKPVFAAIQRTCDPVDYQVHYPDDAGNGSIVEVKCGGGQPGFILDLPMDAPKTIKTLTCEIAARGDDKCQIPGNH
jgi:hypothetical protein